MFNILNAICPLVAIFSFFIWINQKSGCFFMNLTIFIYSYQNSIAIMSGMRLVKDKTVQNINHSELHKEPKKNNRYCSEL